VAPAGTNTCANAVISYNPPQPFTFDSRLDTGGGYQVNVKTPSTMTKGTDLLHFRVVGEASTTYHAEAGASFTIS
jgi:hypothetical protein